MSIKAIRVVGPILAEILLVISHFFNATKTKNRMLLLNIRFLID